MNQKSIINPVAAIAGDVHNAIASQVRVYSVLLEAQMSQTALEVQARGVYEREVEHLTARVREHEATIAMGTTANEKQATQLGELRTRLSDLENENARLRAELDALKVTKTRRVKIAMKVDGEKVKPFT